jgi:hypothetical protein
MLSRAARTALTAEEEVAYLARTLKSTAEERKQARKAMMDAIAAAK